MKQFRNVHIDFHTGGTIPGVGEKFEKEEFKKTLLDAHVDSIQIFAKCHHGYCYYPTKVGTVHPALKFDLLGEQLKACKEAGINASAYITIGYSELDADAHPDWNAYDFNTKKPLAFDYDYNAKPTDSRPFCSWRILCPNNPEYKKHILDICREVVDLYNPDGLFFDICAVGEPCVCPSCVKGMKEQGLDPENREDAVKYFIQQRLLLAKEIREIQEKSNPSASLFFNGTAELEKPEYFPMNTFLSMEDLPTWWGGYDKLPARAFACRASGKHVIGMTGKFHKTWGEFGGFKNPEALRYEVATMLAYGAGCSIGDQLHPSGKIDEFTYKNIGYAYSYGEKIEPWCKNVSPVSKLCIILSSDSASLLGLSKMLLECQCEFDVSDAEIGLDNYSCLIVPNNPKISENGKKNIEKFILSGKKVVLLGNAVQKIDAGITYVGESEYELDYIEKGDGMVSLSYGKAHVVDQNGLIVKAKIRNPYFKRRTYVDYCSHDNTPYSLESVSYPACATRENVLYFAHDVGKNYDNSGSYYLREYFLENFFEHWSDKTYCVSGMLSQSRMVLNRDNDGSFYALHLMSAMPSERGYCNVLEDFPVMRDVVVDVKLNDKIKSAILQPQNKKLKIKKTKGGYVIKMPDFQVHQLVVLEIAKKKQK